MVMVESLNKVSAMCFHMVTLFNYGKCLLKEVISATGNLRSLQLGSIPWLARTRKPIGSRLPKIDLIKMIRTVYGAFGVEFLIRRCLKCGAPYGGSWCCTNFRPLPELGWCASWTAENLTHFAIRLGRL